MLTVNSRYLEDDFAQLATFLHKQFHWFANDNSEQVAASIREFQQMFPEVPSPRAGGARDDYSTYLHLIVCDMEYQAMTRLIGQNAARKVLCRWNHYTWIYEQVLDNPKVQQTMEYFELRIP